MDVAVDLLVLAGLVLLPAAGIVVGGGVLGWLEQYEPEEGAPDSVGSALVAIPFAALSAAIVLAPVVVAVWAVIAEEFAVAYLATVGFALGALLLSSMATASDAAGDTFRWTRLPGVMLTSAVGFFIALTSYLGGALARWLGVSVGDAWLVVIPIGVAVLVGGLALLAYRRRVASDLDDPVAPAPAAQIE